MLSLPAKGTVCRLGMSAHEDQGFRWHIGDLNDMTALGTAAGYCDIVVAEKHWTVSCAATPHTSEPQADRHNQRILANREAITHSVLCREDSVAHSGVRKTWR